MSDRFDYLKAIRRKLGRYKYNEVKYLIGLFGLDCHFADYNRPNKQYDESLKQAQNLRYAFIDGCDAQQKADEKHGVD